MGESGLSSGLSIQQWIKMHQRGNRETLRQLLEIFELERGVSLQPSPGAARLISTELSVMLLQTYAQAEAQKRSVEEVFRQLLDDTKAPKDELALAAHAGVEQFREALMLASQELLEAVAVGLEDRWQLEANHLGERAEQQIKTLEAREGLYLKEVDDRFRLQLQALSQEHQTAIHELQTTRLESRRYLVELVTHVEQIGREVEGLENRWLSLEEAVTAVNIQNRQLTTLIEQATLNSQQAKNLMTMAQKVSREGLRAQRQTTGWIVGGVTLGFLVTVAIYRVWPRWLTSQLGYTVSAVIVLLICAGVWVRLILTSRNDA